MAGTDQWNSGTAILQLPKAGTSRPPGVFTFDRSHCLVVYGPGMVTKWTAPVLGANSWIDQDPHLVVQDDGNLVLIGHLDSGTPHDDWG